MVTHDNDLAMRATRTIIVSDGNVLNEFIKSALPHLDIEQLLDTSARFDKQQYAPGDVILYKGDVGEYFHIITEGQVEVLLDTAGGRQIPVAHLGSGQYFGEMSLMEGGTNFATVRSGSEPVEVLRLGKEGYNHLLAESDSTRETIEAVIRERQVQNKLLLKQNQK